MSTNQTTRNLDTLIPSSKPKQFEFDYLDADNIRVTILLENIYTDNSGNNYYKYVNPLQMTAERHAVAIQAETFFMYNILPSEFIKKMDEIIEGINKQQYIQAGNVALDLKQRAMRLIAEDTTLELAAIYFLIEGEHPGYYIPSEKERKLTLWKSDPAARAFFLRTLLDFLKPYSELSSQDLVNYLQELKPMPEKQMQPAATESRPGRYNLGKLADGLNVKRGKQPAKTPAQPAS